MNMDNINKWFTLAANIGVIAGIIFLAIELQQNNNLLQSQARLGELSASTSRIEIGLNNPELAHINFKAMSGETLTPEEENRYFDYALYTMMHWQWQYDEYLAGGLPEVNLEAWQVQASFSPVWKMAWERTLGTQNTEFTRFVDENVFGE